MPIWELPQEKRLQPAYKSKEGRNACVVNNVVRTDTKYDFVKRVTPGGL